MKLTFGLFALSPFIALLANAEWYEGVPEDRGNTDTSCGGGAIPSKICIGLPAPEAASGLCDKILGGNGRKKSVDLPDNLGLIQYLPTCDAENDSDCLPLDHDNCMRAIDAAYRNAFDGSKPQAGLCSVFGQIYSTAQQPYSKENVIGQALFTGVCQATP